MPSWIGYLSGDATWLWSKLVLGLTQWMNISPFIFLGSIQLQIFQPVQHLQMERKDEAAWEGQSDCVDNILASHSDPLKLHMTAGTPVDWGCLSCVLLKERISQSIYFCGNSWIVFSAGSVLFCDSFIHLFVMSIGSSRDVDITDFLLPYFSIVVLNQLHPKDAVINRRHHFFRFHAQVCLRFGGKRVPSRLQGLDWNTKATESPGKPLLPTLHFKIQSVSIPEVSQCKHTSATHCSSRPRWLLFFLFSLCRWICRQKVWCLCCSCEELMIWQSRASISGARTPLSSSLTAGPAGI